MAAVRGLPRPPGGAASPLPGSCGVPTPATRLAWFAVAHTLRRVEVEGVRVELPASLVHAKRMGAVVTACGLSTMSWPKLFGLRFPLPRTAACPECVEIVTPLRAGA